jgi:nitrite reductase (NO-forming)
MFNGVAQQYLNNPIEVDTGADVRLFVLDVGPSIDSSFHVVGTIFHSVTKEGVQLAEGNDGSWGSQAVDLAPAQGAVIEFRAMEDGLYPFVTHAFNFPGRGAVGLFQAGDGEP